MLIIVVFKLNGQFSTRMMFYNKKVWNTNTINFFTSTFQTFLLFILMRDINNKNVQKIGVNWLLDSKTKIYKNFYQQLLSNSY